jgi:hypothetical protein
MTEVNCSDCDRLLYKAKQHSNLMYFCNKECLGRNAVKGPIPYPHYICSVNGQFLVAALSSEAL